MKEKRRIEILETTLRDGTQGMGVSFSENDKIDIINLFDFMNFEYIECSNPLASKSDRDLFCKVSDSDLKHSKLVSFSATRKKDTLAKDDAGLNAVLETGTSVVSLFGKASLLHVEEVLGASAEENLAMIFDSIKYLKDAGKVVFFDLEHFFDGYYIDKKYAYQAIDTCISAGADKIVLCDTNGGVLPMNVQDILAEISSSYNLDDFGVHFHNDSGLAVANTIVAVDCGINHIQGTFLGFGERCGNTTLASVIPTIAYKLGHSILSTDAIANLTPVGQRLSDIANSKVQDNEPYIGGGAFYHKAGMHADGILKNSKTFEHISPSFVGNIRHFPISEMSGRRILKDRLSALLPDVDFSDELIVKIYSQIKEMESEGWQFEQATASLVILIKKMIGTHRKFFQLTKFRSMSEKPAIDNYTSSAMLKIAVDGVSVMRAADGDGPVHALDIALKSALKKFYPEIEKVQMTDYKVRVLDGSSASASKVRVLYSSTDGESVWTTVGVSRDIIEASWMALRDSIEYMLMGKDGDSKR